MSSTLFYSCTLPLSFSSLIRLINIDSSQLIISNVFHIIQNWPNVFHVYLFHISFKAWKYTLYCRSWEIGNEPDISWYKLENYTKQTLFTKNLEAGWGRAQRYYGQFGLIPMGGRSNTLWGRLGFENWLFTASLKIGWTTCLGIIAIFQQVIIAWLGPCNTRLVCHAISGMWELSCSSGQDKWVLTKLLFFAHQVREKFGDGGTSEVDFDFHDTSSFFSGRFLSLGAISVS